jgi:hypothetical protein
VQLQVRDAVISRCHEQGIAKTCHKVVEAGNDDFRPVYESVWTTVHSREAHDCAVYEAVAADLH